MTARSRLVAEVLARAQAAGRRVYGFTSGRASCAELAAPRRKRPDDPPDAGIVPDEWNYICVEGEATWVALPPAPTRGNSK